MYTTGDIIANRYEVIGFIGDGGQAEVYAVADSVEGDTVALKILDPTASAPLGPWAEAQILRRLSDNHILPIRNATTHLGFRVLVTEIAGQGTIAGQIEANPNGIDVDTAVRWTRQACQGVNRAHDHNLVHNDIKPANLFLTSQANCLVADFGYAGLTDAATGLAPVYGATVATMAPEVAATWNDPSQPDRATAKTDVYSLAASAFWMLTGQTPHDFSTAATDTEKVDTVANTVARRVRDVAPHVPGTIARVVDVGLSQNPAKRHQTAHQFAAALGRKIKGRRWVRTDEHPPHLACWRGTPAQGGVDYLLCMERGITASQRILNATHANSGNRIKRGCSPATASTWPRIVRRLMTELA